ncbi:MAG: TonB-dependent receptor [Parvibaculum sp.]
MKKTGWGAFAALTLAACAAASAQAGEAIETPELLVSGGIEPIPTKEVASSYTIVTAEEIEKFQYQDITDALRSVPGVHVVPSGARGSVTSVFTRGANSNQTLVLVNGMPINDPSSPGGSANLAGIPLDSVERIEVVRGPQSALYGSQAIGGVINLITKTGAGDPSVMARIEGGTLGTLNTYASTGGSFGASDYFLSLTREDTDGNDITPSRLHDARGGEDDGTETLSASGRIGTEFNEHLSGSIFAQYTDAEADTDSDGSTAGFISIYQNVDSIFESRRLFLSGDLEGRFMDGRWRPRFSLGYTLQDSDSSDDPDPGGSVYLDRASNEGRTIKAAFDNAFDLSGEHLLTFGGSYTRDEFESSGYRDLGGFVISLNSDAKTDAFAVYAADQMTFGERFFATVSARHDMPEDMDDRFTFTLAPGYYHPETDTRLTLSYGTGFKTPSLYQRYGFDVNTFGGFPSGVYNGNPNLEPEKSKGWEIGIEQGLLDGKAMAGATWFDTEIEDAISIVFVGVNSTAVNIDKLDTKGLEAFFEINPVDAFTARLDYTLTILKSDQFASSMVRRPRHQIGLTASWEVIPGTVLSTNAEWVDIYRDVPRDSFGFYVDPAPYTLVNVAASHRLTENVKLTARVNNLLDTTYEPANGFEAPGIEALAGVQVTF